MKQIKNVLKTASFTLLATLISCTSSAQNPTISTKHSDSEIANLIQNYKNSRNRDVRVDGVLSQNFRQHFPNARDVEWETNDEIFEVEFEIQNRDFQAYYDKDGNLLLFIQDIGTRELPSNVRNVASERYPRYRIDDVDRIVKGTQTFFKIEMELRDHDVTIYIANDGTVLDRRPIY
ncbi:MAG: PepSY-like domain-containing protein [Bacteroidales bacterium]|nr:PepSY-like domain-containing protein [Bacteroidales bacterium]